MAKEKIEGLREKIVLPEGVGAEMIERELIIKKDEKEIKRRIAPIVDVKIEDGKVVLSCFRDRKIERKMFGTVKAHIKNMIKGLAEDFKYKLQVANVHFPMTVSVNKSTNELIIKNFLGEKTDRKVKLIKGVDVKVDRDIIEIESFDKEKAGQCAANIEKGARVRNKDRRIFQDGIFIIEKPGRSFM